MLDGKLEEQGSWIPSLVGSTDNRSEEAWLLLDSEFTGWGLGVQSSEFGVWFGGLGANGHLPDTVTG